MNVYCNSTVAPFVQQSAVLQYSLLCVEHLSQILARHENTSTIISSSNDRFNCIDHSITPRPFLSITVIYVNCSSEKLDEIADSIEIEIFVEVSITFFEKRENIYYWSGKQPLFNAFINDNYISICVG